MLTHRFPVRIRFCQQIPAESIQSDCPIRSSCVQSNPDIVQQEKKAIHPALRNARIAFLAVSCMHSGSFCHFAVRITFQAAFQVFFVAIFLFSTFFLFFTQEVIRKTASTEFHFEKKRQCVHTLFLFTLLI